MSYREYVIAAYAVFAAVLAWDYLAARLGIQLVEMTGQNLKRT